MARAPKRPRDANQLAKLMVAILTADLEGYLSAEAEELALVLPVDRQVSAQTQEPGWGHLDGMTPFEEGANNFRCEVR
jgi:hypothetical protein